MASADPLPPWRPLLRGARQQEGRTPHSRWLQLASVAADGTPRLRTLVFRGWAGCCLRPAASAACAARCCPYQQSWMSTRGNGTGRV